MGHKKKITLGIIALLIIIVLVVVVGKKNDLIHTNDGDDGRGVSGDPIDISVDFYSAWRNAKLSTSTNPYEEGIVDSQSLSKKMSDALNAKKQDYLEKHIDPVLCATGTPSQLRTRKIFKTDTDASVMLLPEIGKDSDVSVMTLSSSNGLWKITSITCTHGEKAPDQGEFTFDTEGRLLRESLKEPYDPSRWHIVYAENGIEGHVAPLFFSASSTCILKDGTKTTCSDDLFTEPIKVRVKGEMTEEGVQVKDVTILE